MFIGFSHFGHFLEILAVAETVLILNVALKKEAKYCNITKVPKVVDGDTNYLNSETMAEPCEDHFHSFLVVNLVEQYNIQYVVVYYGNDVRAANLNYFVVQLIIRVTNTSKQTAWCSEYPFKIPHEPQGMRVNCMPTMDIYSEVQLSSRNNNGFSIAEIEVFGRAMSSNENIMIYRGCFNTFSLRNEITDLKTCLENCYDRRRIFAGIKANTYCGCDNNVDLNGELPTITCNWKCDDGVNYCGSEAGYSVYLVNPPFPSYFGCYRSPNVTIKKAHLSGDMTVEKCLFRCEEYRYAKLQTGNYCICDNDDPSMILRDVSKHCTEKCTGNPSLTCGGNEYAAIYATCIKYAGRNYIKCSQLFLCNESSYDMYGVCSGCKPGYLGSYCFERNASELHSLGSDNESRPSEDDDNDITYFILKMKLNAMFPFLLAWATLFIIGLMLFCSTPKRSDDMSSETASYSTYSRRPSTRLSFAMS